MSSQCPFSFLTRRSFLKSAGSGLGALALGSKIAQAAQTVAPPPLSHPSSVQKTKQYSFWGKHQAGIITPAQNHTYFAALDLTTSKREDVIELLKNWSAAAEKLTRGESVEVKLKAPPKHETQEEDSYAMLSRADSGEAVGLSSSRLTLTFGFGPGLFSTSQGVDRYGLAQHKPQALVDLPKFHGDELIESKSGGDLSIQACADDPQVAFHAVRQLLRFAANVAVVRWVQTGFGSETPAGETPRNLMGFKDGTQQPKSSEHDQYVWVGPEGPSWLQGGSYLVTRRIRIALEHWDGTDVEFQEQVIGRKKISGAPLGQKHEHEVMNLLATDKDGNYIIPENSHVRLASSAANDGAQMLRRGYSYNDGANITAERWPPWRQGMEYDAGLFFLGYQKDPRSGFIKIFGNMAKLDALNQFTTHVGSGIFVCPPGCQKGEYIGQKLFEAL